MLLKMYKKSQNKQNGNSSDKELIDISSDDDVSKVESNSNKINEPEIVEKDQQKPGPSSGTEKAVHAKEVEQQTTVNLKLSLIELHFLNLLLLNIIYFKYNLI